MKNPIKNQGGSALAYVLIFSVIIMVLVVGLLTVAQSGISFTQQTVESRQAYIDAKSVIEYGKTIINVWESELAKAISDYNKVINDEDSTEAEIARVKKAVAQLNDENIKYYICSDGDDNATSLKTEIVESEDTLGQVFLVAPSEEDTYDITKYTFKVTTQKLRRTLDYQVVFDGGSSSGGTISEPSDDSKDWLDTQIKRKNSYQELQCVVQKNGNTKDYDSVNKVLDVYEPDSSLNIGKDKNNPNANNTKFEWWQECTLNMSAKNICFTAAFPLDKKSVWKSEFNITADDQIRIKQDYVQNNTAEMTNTFEAENIIFEGDITLADASNLVIKCKNLWIKGDINIVTGSGTNAALKIEAENIIIGDYEKHSGGNITVGNASQIKIEKVETYDCNNLWIRGNVNLVSSGGTSTILKVDSKNIYVGDYNKNFGGKVTIGDKSQLDLNCTGDIMIRDDLELLTNSTTPENNLTAKNISIGTAANSVNMTVHNATRVIWNCDNFWLHGDMTTTSSGSYQEFNNIKYFQAGTINLSDKCTFKIDGKDSSDNQVIVDNIIPLESNAYTLEIKDLELFKCNGNLGLTDNSTMDLKADNILIGGNVSFSFTNDIKIKTDYLDISGSTTINRTYKEVLIEGLSNLEARFNGGYDQTNSTVTIRNADKTIFSGANFKFGGDGVGSATLNIASDSIYLDAQKLAFTQYYGSETVGLKYTAKNGTAGNLSLRQTIDWNPNNNISINTINARDYQNVIGSFPQASVSSWLYEQGTGTYTVPSWTALNIELQPPTEPPALDPESSSETDPDGDDDGSGDGGGGNNSYVTEIYS
ncbi:MAG: hypothetical protein AB7D35_11395 [Bacteroidales bacterium]